MLYERILGREERVERVEREEMVEMVERVERYNFRELIDGVTTHAFNMVDFIMAAKDFGEKLALRKSVFCYSKTRLQVFFKNKGKSKKCKIHLKGFKGASWFNYQIQLTRFLPKNAEIIEITILHACYEMVVVFLPRVFVQKKQRKYKCPLLTVDTKTGEATWGTNSFYPSIYNPIVEEDLF